MTSIRAIIFDIGGVCVGSPLEGISKFEREHNIPHNYINVTIAKSGENGSFQRLERGEITLYEFYQLFDIELSSPISKQRYIEYFKSRGTLSPSIPETIKIDVKVLFRDMMSEATRIDPIVFNALRNLRISNKFKLVAITNNFQVPADEIELFGGSLPSELKDLFDEYFESSVLGLRKPDPKIFLYACEKSGIEPKEAIFLDDIGINLKSAKDLGMQTIKVEVGQSYKAIKELEHLTGIVLFDDGASSKI